MWKLSYCTSYDHEYMSEFFNTPDEVLTRFAYLTLHTSHWRYTIFCDDFEFVPKYLNNGKVTLMPQKFF